MSYGSAAGMGSGRIGGGGTATPRRSMGGHASGSGQSSSRALLPLSASLGGGPGAGSAGPAAGSTGGFLGKVASDAARGAPMRCGAGSLLLSGGGLAE